MHRTPAPGRPTAVPGSRKGTPLTFNMQFATGITTQTDAVNDEISSWKSAGIHVNETTSTFDTVIGNATACTPGPSCTWEIRTGPGSWVYSPDIYPTGEELFATGAVANYGSYSDPQADSLHQASTDFTNASLDNYENLLAKDAAGHLPAAPGAVPDRDPEQPAWGHPAEHPVDAHPGELVLRQVAGSPDGAKTMASAPGPGVPGPWCRS